jgi:hypothetical protein
MDDPLFTMTLEGADQERLTRDPSYLRSLCQKEVSRFVDYVQHEDPQFRDGLAKFERLAIEGYLYQKARGHIDAFHGQDVRYVERTNG